MAPGVGGYRQINKALNVCAFEDYLQGQQKSLPKLLNVEQISPRVIRVLGQNPGKFTLQGTNTYIVGTGSKRLIIDTGQGIPEWAELISTTLTKGNFTLSHVLLTHWHGDHTGGVPDLVARYPALSTAIYKHTPGKTQQPIAHNQTFRVEGATLRAVHAPGHSHDHVCFVLEEENAMFTGDNVLGHGTAAVEHLGQWMATLRAMQARGCARGYPAHGAVIPDLPGKIAGELRGKVRRERQALQALQAARGVGSVQCQGRGGRMTVGELVTAVYGASTAGAVRELALEPFMDEVLRKLAEDGMVGFDMRGGVKRWFAVV
ncbi:beta-lactamase-like protein [Chaetomium sp. MPI-CAGE-AT-0009]|nr:beta-lactamase-like protein [Chaetomium sp. MPI-CAGE-AT-0009]